MAPMPVTRLVVTLAFRSIWTHKAKTLIVGSLMFFGTMLVVVGTALLDSIEFSMAQSIISSLSGHIQVYDANAKDSLALFGSGFMGMDDIGEINDFEPLRETLVAQANVKAVIPMGIGLATMTTPDESDQLILALRKALASEKTAEIPQIITQIQEMARELAHEYKKRRLVSSDKEGIDKAQTDLARLQTEAFWKGLEKEPELTLQFLDTRFAPLSSEGRMLYLKYLGTDLEAFVEHFDRFLLVKGQAVPPGKRGLLLSERFYEKIAKHKVAKDLDRMQRNRKEGKDIAEDALMEHAARSLPGQYQQIIFQLTPEEAKHLARDLRTLLPNSDGLPLKALVQAFLRVDDANFDLRYAQFYEHIAPKIQLYPFEVGNVVTLQAYTRGGYLKSVNVRLWGIFRFQGLEKSDIAGAQNLVDMLTFRELYGKMTAEKREELVKIRDSVGITELSRGNAEDVLFGDGEALERGEGQGRFDELSMVDIKKEVAALKEVERHSFDQQAINHGLALNVAVILKDPDRLEETLAHLETLATKQPVQVVDWQEASGMVGQFVTVIRVVLYIAIFIIFLVALVIINNSMIIATMERVSEIGTMRAIGADRRFVLAIFLLETLMLGLFAGALGSLVGAALMLFFGVYGISSGGIDILVFFFSGPRLYPTIEPYQMLLGLTVIILASLASTLYPALMATRIQPVVAMQDKG
jgi:ABC-type lipoprotein release transport system permease subunit